MVIRALLARASRTRTTLLLLAWPGAGLLVGCEAILGLQHRESSEGQDEGGPRIVEAGEAGDERAQVAPMDAGDEREAGCRPGTQTCMGTSLVTCEADGQWGAPWPCATGMCAGNACSGETTAATSCPDGGAGLGTAQCGATGESCCTSIEVPGGTYDRQYVYTDAGTVASEDAAATISGFRLDKYEVTTARFAEFVAASGTDAGAVPPARSGKHEHLNGGQGLSNNATPPTYEVGWIESDSANIATTAANLGSCKPYSTSGQANAAQLPINCVNWYEAYAFCIWDGGFLPSEAEWEYVAAGGMQEREYPWGSTDPGTMNDFAICGDGTTSCFYPQLNACTNYQAIAAVGTATQGAGALGHFDLAGNVWEWNLDWYSATYVDPCQDCAEISPGPTRTLRGGSFNDSAPTLRSYNRDNTAPTTRSGGIGFRCARVP